MSGITNDNFSSIPRDFKSIYNVQESGRLPMCALQSAPGLQAGIVIHPQAAEQLGKLMVAASQAGYAFTISSAYRTYEQQVELVGGDPRDTRRGVATPGNSMHGWGTAIDITQLFRLADTVSRKYNNDKFAPAVHKEIRDTNPLYKWLDENAPKYGWVNPLWARNGSDYDECWHWEYKVFSSNWPNTLPPSVIYKPSTGAVTRACDPVTPIRQYYARNPTGQTPRTPSVTPYLGSLESFHPNIQYELTRRRVSSETANVYMPFVRLTSLINVYGDNLLGGTIVNGCEDKKDIQGYCPSLGPHGQDYVEFNEIYVPQDNRSIVGFATKEINVASEQSVILQPRTPLIVSKADAESTDQYNVPMPGITELDLERTTAGPMGVRGGLMKANIKILAYSVGQLNTLLTYFLRPATRVVLEIGRQSSNPKEQIVGYNWNAGRSTIQTDFTNIIYNPEAQKKFIEDTVYRNNGNYEIFVGYVVKFDLKYNKNNIYEIALTIHSIQQFEIPTTHTGVKSFCSNAVDKCKVMDIREYFDTNTSWKQNSFKQLMNVEEEAASVATDAQKTKEGYGDNFIAIRNPTTADTGGGSREAGLDENEYFVSWRFFVEKILNDRYLGIAGIIPDSAENTATLTAAPTDVVNMSPRQLLQLGLLRPVAPTTNIDERIKSGLIANEVGYHPNLRSTDPNVMIIWNPAAQANRSTDERQNFVTLLDAAIGESSTEQRTYFNSNNQLVTFITGSSVGPFSKVISRDSIEASSGFLENGVWLNTKAIKEAFSTADTVSAAINLLLSKMNAATQGYWNLQLYSMDRLHSGLFVIDMGLSKRLSKTTTSTNDNVRDDFLEVDKEENETSPLSSIDNITKTRYMKVPGVPESGSRYIYMFNRGTKALDKGEHLGSDLIDINVEFNLPQVIAVQAIAGVGGPAQKSTLQSINIKELQRLNLIPNLFAKCDDVCKDEDCNRASDELATLKIKMDEAQTKTTEFSKNNPESITTQQLPQNATEEQIRTFIEQQNQVELERTRLQQAADQARSDYYTAKVQRSGMNGMVISTVAELSSLGTLLDLIEFNSAAMLKKLNKDSVNAEDNRAQPFAHAFNSSNLTKTVVNLTLPGIGGIELFQSFLVDRVPSILKRGYYVVTKVIHKFSAQNGWTTNIEGRFRYRPRPDIDPCLTGNEQDYDICKGAPSSTTSPQPPAVGSGPTAQRSARAGQAPSNPDEQFDRMLPNMSNATLYNQFLTYEQSAIEPKRPTIAELETWERKLKSGQVTLARRRLEKVKAEIRKRIDAGIRAGRGQPDEFNSLSTFRLRASDFRGAGTSGTF